MSSKLDDLKARLLLMDHNRRAKLLSTAMAHPWQRRFRWKEALWTIGLLALVVWLISVTSWREGLFVCALVNIVAGVIGEQVATMDNRIDALIELFQQDGMLQSQPRASRFPDDKKAIAQP